MLVAPVSAGGGPVDAYSGVSLRSAVEAAWQATVAATAAREVLALPAKALATIRFAGRGFAAWPGE